MFATRFKDGPELYSPLPLCLCISRMRKGPARDEEQPHYFWLPDEDHRSCSLRLSQNGLVWFPQDIRIRFNAGVSRTNIRTRTRRVISNCIWLSLVSILAFCGMIAGTALHLDFTSFPLYFCFWTSLVFPAQLLLTVLDFFRPRERLQHDLHVRLDAQPITLPCRLRIVPLTMPHAMILLLVAGWCPAIAAAPASEDCIFPADTWESKSKEGITSTYREINGKRYWGYEGPGGVVGELKYDGTDDYFSEGLGAVKIGEQWGFMDRSGSLVIPTAFDFVRFFHGGRAAVTRAGKLGFVDPQGVLVVPPVYDRVDDFNCGLAAVAEEERWGYVDEIGGVVIPLRFDSAGPFSEGLASVSSKRDAPAAKADPSLPSGIWEPGPLAVGFIDPTGKWVISPRFNAALPFTEGLAAVRLGDQWYTHCATLHAGRWGYTDRKGELVIPARYNACRPFSEGLAAACEASDTGGPAMWGFINHAGDWVIQPQFHYEPSSFAAGVAQVRSIAFREFFINRQGERVPKPK